jgi:hypothetical protein
MFSRRNGAPQDPNPSKHSRPLLRPILGRNGGLRALDGNSKTNMIMDKDLS